VGWAIHCLSLDDEAESAAPMAAPATALLTPASALACSAVLPPEYSEAYWRHS
jgi:hypothetical protein